MKLTFYSNFLNHHQIPICDYFYSKLGDNFKFIATEEVPEERRNMGYLTDFNAYPYLIETYQNNDNYHHAIELGALSDVVIIGSSDEVFIKERLEKNLLTFRYSERLFKKGFLYFFHPKALLKRFKLDTLLRRKNVWMLSSSAYTPFDYSFYLAYPNRYLKWGYFPKTQTYNIHEVIKYKRNQSFLWVGRFIDWKRPIMAVKLIHQLKQDGEHVSLDMIGVGDKLDEVIKYIKVHHLENEITIHGAKSPDEVRQYMLESSYYLFTSNREEGWGAVLNEAMNSACVVFANYQIGSAPYLIDQNVDGIMYKNAFDLYKKVKHVMHEEEKKTKIALNAYFKMTTLWHHEIAADRFLEFSKNVLSGKIVPFEEGPISRASVISESKVKRKNL